LTPPEALTDRVPLPEGKERSQRKCICVVIRRNTTVSKLVGNTFYWSTDCIVGLTHFFLFKFFIFPETVIFVWKIMQG
jgi:hypothetical protein